MANYSSNDAHIITQRRTLTVVVLQYQLNALTICVLLSYVAAFTRCSVLHCSGLPTETLA